MESSVVPQHVQSEMCIAENIIELVIGRATGRAVPQCEGELPRDVYFIGNLRPVPLEAEAERWLADLADKMAPVAFGIEVITNLSGAETTAVPATMTWCVYYRVRPRFEDQLAFQSPKSTTTGTDDINNSGSGANTPTGTTTLERPKPVFKKVCCRAQSDIIIDGRSGVVNLDMAAFQQAINAELDRARQVAQSDPDVLRVGPRQNPEQPNKIDQRSMDSEASFDQYWRNLPDVPVTPWVLKLDATAKSCVGRDGTNVIQIDVVNETQLSQRDEVHEPFVFDISFSVDFPDQAIVPYELMTAPEDFREDPHMFGRGRNCAVECTGGRLCVTHTPVYRQGRYVAREEPIALVNNLCDDPLPLLLEIKRAMDDYDSEWAAALLEYQAKTWWSPEFEDRFTADRVAYATERASFARGISLIQSNHDIEYAFRLTNMAFRRNGLDRWRLMQIVFFVSQIPGLTTDDDERRAVDVIYFPTGGGKTEAYLAVVVFSCFWDRIRGKAGGITAWARFPLRLLTVQQLQRFANIIASAELIRVGEPDTRLRGSDVDGFAVGYYVGQGGTPNKILGEGNTGSGLPWVQAEDVDLRQKYKRITVCPSCRDSNNRRTKSVVVDFDRDKVMLVHRCTNQNCSFPGGVLPIYVVDNDIYRYLPSVMVGTIDKLAQIGIERKFSMLLGNVDGKCNKHGYFNGKCCQDGCRETLRTGGAVRGLSGPTVFVQDELHLLREGLGTFDSHYETLFQKLMTKVGTNETIKIIASSATIEQFERQVSHLYAREHARVFPGLGPRKGESFYAVTKQYPQRIFVGVLPHNKTLLNALLEFVEYYLRALSSLKVLPPATMSGIELRKLLTLYSASATYFIANRDLDSFKADLMDDVFPNLRRDSLAEPSVFTLTGATVADEVSDTLDALERGSIPSDAAQFVLATNTISHGVDIDRLNCMFFYGTPRQTAEYIQASSRVGRKHVGIVFMCFTPSRERDQSHYHYFAKQHEFLGKLVEPVPVNRWSKFSLDRTLPGALNAFLLHSVSAGLALPRRNDIYFLDKVKLMFANDTIRVDDVEATMMDAYTLDEQTANDHPEFKERLQSRLQAIIYDQIITNTKQVTFVSEAMTPPPMRSLREVDEQVPIRLDPAGSAWARLRTQKKVGNDNADDAR